MGGDGQGGLQTPRESGVPVRGLIEHTEEDSHRSSHELL